MLRTWVNDCMSVSPYTQEPTSMPYNVFYRQEHLVGLRFDVVVSFFSEKDVTSKGSQKTLASDEGTEWGEQGLVKENLKVDSVPHARKQESYEIDLTNRGLTESQGKPFEGTICRHVCDRFLSF